MTLELSLLVIRDTVEADMDVLSSGLSAPATSLVDIRAEKHYRQRHSRLPDVFGNV